MSANPPCEQIAELEKEKTFQYSQGARDSIEDKIIDLVDNYLMSSSYEYRAVSAEYERLMRTVEVSKGIVEYTLALNEALKQTRGAIGTHIADFLIPGEIGTIGSSIQTGIASRARNNASNIFNKISDSKNELKAIGDTKLTDLIEGLDVLLDAIKLATRKSGLDITSLISAGDQSMAAGDIDKIGKATYGIFEKINALDLENQTKKMENAIKNSINEVRQRCIVY